MTEPTQPGQPRSLIVGFDTSGRSDAAVRAALDMHARFDTRIEVLHAVDIPPPESVSGRPDKVVELEAEIVTRAWDECAEHLAGILAQGTGDAAALSAKDILHTLTGHPAKVLVERAEFIDADMIVLGPHAKRGLFDFGSTSRAVLGKAPCNVWIQPETYAAIERILVPTDLSEDSLIALGTACGLARGYGARVAALHCYIPPALAYAAGPGYAAVAAPEYVVEEERKAAAERFRRVLDEFDWRGVEHELRFFEGSPADVILEQQPDCDLIAMGSHGRTGLSAVVLGNVAYSVLKQSDRPVLAIRHRKRGWLL